MATTREEFFRVLKSIEAKLDSTGRKWAFASGKSDASGVIAELKILLTELESHALTLSSIDTKLSETQSETDVSIADLLISGGRGNARWLAEISDTDLPALGVILSAISASLIETISMTDVSVANLLISTGGSGIANLTSSIRDDVESNRTQLISIDAELVAINTKLSSLDALLTTIDSDTNEIGNNTDGLEGTQSDIKSKLDTIITSNQGIITEVAKVVDDTSGLQSELESIDDNWNILSANNVALAAILVAVLNNATSGRQDTMNTHLSAIETDGNNIQTLLDDSGYVATSGTSTTLTLLTATLTLTYSIAASDVEQIMAIRVTGETTSVRTITFDLVIGGSTSYELLTFTTLTAAGVDEWHSTKFDQMRKMLVDLRLTSNCEIKVTVSAVTAAESIVVRIATVKVKD